MLTVRSKASADWLLIFSACMPLVAGLLLPLISLVVMLIIKTRSWRVSWWLSSLQIYFTHISPCFLLAGHVTRGCVTWLHHEISHVLIASRTAWRGVITHYCRRDCVTVSALESCVSLHHVIVSRACQRDTVTWHHHLLSSLVTLPFTLALSPSEIKR